MTGEGEYPETTSDQWVSESSGSPIRAQSFEFSIQVIGLYKFLQNQSEFVVSKQLLRSGTSIGANVEEAAAAESRRDFLHKMCIALKEARESHYWLRLLDESDLAPEIDVKTHLTMANDLIRLLTAIVKTTRANS